MMVQDLESITIYFKLFIIKSLHAKLVMEAYNHMTSSIGKDICLKGWKKSSVQGAMETAWKIDLDWEGDNDNIFDVFIEDDEGDD